MKSNHRKFSRGVLYAALPVVVACSSGGDSFDSSTSALAPPMAGVAEDANPDVGWVLQAVPVLLGRPVRSFGELKFLTVAVSRYGQGVVADALMSDPSFVDRWTGVLLDRLEVDREGPRAQSGCFGRPLLATNAQQATAAQIVLRTARAGATLADSAPPAPPGTYNMADVVRGSIVLDDAFPAYRGFLFTLVNHRDPQADDEPRNIGDHFTQVYLNKSATCLQCHNTTHNCSAASYVPGYSSWDTGHEAHVGFTTLGAGAPGTPPPIDPAWTSSFVVPTSGAVVPFAGWDAAGCGAFGPDVSVAMTGASATLLPHAGNVWQLDAQLKDGYVAVAQAVASRDIDTGVGHSQEGRAIGAYWLAAAFTNDVWREVFGDPLTIPNFVYRNHDERGVDWSLAEQGVIQSGFSLKALLRRIVTSRYFNRRVEATPRMPTVFEPFQHPEGPYTADFSGDAVHRRSADLLFRMKAAALGWKTSDGKPYVTHFPSSTDPASPRYPTHDDAQAMSLYLSTSAASPKTPIMSQIGMLGWEASAGRCEKPAAIALDWIDGLVARATTTPGVTMGDAIEALRYRLLGRGMTNDPSTVPGVSSEALAIQTFLGGRPLTGTFASTADANTTLRAVCSVFTKTPQFMLEGVMAEPEPMDFNAAPRLSVGDMRAVGGAPTLDADAPTDACMTWRPAFLGVMPAGTTVDCSYVDFPPRFPWGSVCIFARCFYWDEMRFRPDWCPACNPGTQWITTLPAIDPRVEFMSPPNLPARTGAFMLWTETSTLAFASGALQIVRGNGKVEPSPQAGAQLAPGDALELWPGAQFKLIAADGQPFSSPAGGMPKADAKGTWLVMTTGKKSLPPMPPVKAVDVDRTTAAATVAALRDAQRNEEPGSVAFLHTVTAPSGNVSVLSNPKLDGNPKAVVLVSPVVGAVSNAHNVGVYYDGVHWAVYNEDGAAMPSGATFSVRAMTASNNAFIHRTTSTNVSAHVTYIDDAPIVGNASVLAGQAYVALQVTHVWNAPGLQGIYENHPVGVYYDGSRWAIYNEDFAAMPVGTAFTVKVGGFETVTSSAATRVGAELVIDDAATNGAPGAHLFLTHNWNPPGVPGTYSTKLVALSFDTKLQKWAIVNVDGSPVADNVSFNVHRGY